MKKLFVLLMLIGAGASLMAQNKVEKYCIIQIYYVPFSTKVVARLDSGYEEPSFDFKDSSIVSKLKTVQDQTTMMGTFNYMASLGWKYMNLLGSNARHRYLYCFSKVFDASELK